MPNVVPEIQEKGEAARNGLSDRAEKVTLLFSWSVDYGRTMLN